MKKTKVIDPVLEQVKQMEIEPPSDPAGDPDGPETGQPPGPEPDWIADSSEAETDRQAPKTESQPAPEAESQPASDAVPVRRSRGKRGKTDIASSTNKSRQKRSESKLQTEYRNVLDAFLRRQRP